MLNKEDLNFQYVIDYDYDGSNDCEAYGCNMEGICRCYTIESVGIKVDDNINDPTKIVLDKILDIMYKTNGDIAQQRDIVIDSLLDESPIDLKSYFVERLLSIYKVYDTEYWEADYGGNYYGDEVFGIYMLYADKLINDINYHFHDNYVNQIYFLLEKEYGKILPKLNGKKWANEIIEMKDIIFGQKEHYENVPIIERYKDANFNGIRGILLKEGDKYRVIDGYHRLKSTNSDVVNVLVASD